MSGCSTQRRPSSGNVQPRSSVSPRSLSPDFPDVSSSFVHHRNARVCLAVDRDEVKQSTGVKTGVEPTSASAPSPPLRNMSFSSSILGSFGSPNNCDSYPTRFLDPESTRNFMLTICLDRRLCPANGRTLRKTSVISNSKPHQTWQMIVRNKSHLIMK